MEKESIESLMVDSLQSLNISPDGRYCYGYNEVTSRDVVNKIEELIDKFNKLVEVIANGKM